MPTAPYGSWKSPITTELMTAGSVGLSDLRLADGLLAWIESRPTEAGRRVIVRQTGDGSTREINPAPFNARTRVHEYGGDAYLVPGDAVVFANYADQRLYVAEPGQSPVPLTPDEGGGVLRYADLVHDPRDRLICIREDHRAARHEADAVNEIVAIALTGDAAANAGQTLVSGHDFYSSPRVSADGSRLAWLAWNHPNMPWDGCELWVADIAASGDLHNQHQIAGGDRESIFQPEWTPGGALCFISDQTGWWNLYRWNGDDIEALCPMEAEFGVPEWVFGLSTYAVIDDATLVCAFGQKGEWSLARLDMNYRQFHPYDLPFTDIESVQADHDAAYFIGGSPIASNKVIRLDLATGTTTVLSASSSVSVDPGYLSVPEAVTFPTTGGLTAHAFYYAPKNAGYTASPDELPPLIVTSHGGPTSSTASSLAMKIQFWTSRGFAVLDVNYGGSTGYGRAYRERLNDQWGIVDVDDCANGARFLVDQGRVDGKRLAIRGSSASGYTTLAALTFHDVFQAGASLYGISDLEAMAADTHKFESRYLDGLIGPYPARRDLYQERSPVHHVDRLNCPLILFQGLEDKVVPPNQAEMMYDAVKAKGLPVAYVSFEGEQHGFRKAENIRRALEAELYFYGKIFGFTPADSIEPVPIANLSNGS